RKSNATRFPRGANRRAVRRPSHPCAVVPRALPFRVVHQHFTGQAVQDPEEHGSTTWVSPTRPSKCAGFPRQLLIDYCDRRGTVGQAFPGEKTGFSTGCTRAIRRGGKSRWWKCGQSESEGQEGKRRSRAGCVLRAGTGKRNVRERGYNPASPAKPPI